MVTKAIKRELKGDELKLKDMCRMFFRWSTENLIVYPEDESEDGLFQRSFRHKPYQFLKSEKPILMHLGSLLSGLLNSSDEVPRCSYIGKAHYVDKQYLEFY